MPGGKQLNDPTDVVVRDEQPNEMIAMIERLALSPDMNPDNLEKMLNMQERVLNRNEEHAYNAAMVACQNEIPKVGKNKKGEKPNTAYATLENVIGVAGPVWAKHGFALEFYEGDSPEGVVRVCCDVRHIEGHVEHRKLDMPLDNLGPKGQPNKTATQGTGSSFSYGKRYLSCGIFNIATGDDNDGAGAVANTLTISVEQIDEILVHYGELPEAAQAKSVAWIRSMGFDAWIDITIARYDEILLQISATAKEFKESK
jgi:hypothetical protein